MSRPWNHAWVLFLIASWGAPAADAKPEAAKTDPAILAAQVKEIFRNHCLECHGGGSTQGDIEILNHPALLAKKVIVPNKPEESTAYLAAIEPNEDARMPQGLPPLPATEIESLRQWILAGAPVFPADVIQPAETNKDDGLKDIVGVDYVLKQILAHQRTLSIEERRFVRYFSCNHLTARGATRDELDLQREALSKAINHLSRESQIVRPEPIDGATASVFAIDIRRVGWHKQPYEVIDGEKKTKSDVNLFDLVLLEYPYGIIYEDSETFDALVLEYFQPAKLVRPIPYVRTDWFSSVATSPPLYHDLLQLPHKIEKLEAELRVDAAENIKNNRVHRAGMIVSGVSRNNRAVERHAAATGFYWKSIDYATSKGSENLFTDPINLVGAGGEMIFQLPNGLQGYYLATSKGDRLDSAPTEIVTDKFAEDNVVRNGLSCIRCHDRGMKEFKDDVRPAVEMLLGNATFSKREVLALYPSRKIMDALVAQDSHRFLAATAEAIGKPQGGEALIPVSRRFLDGPLQLAAAASELGLASPAEFKTVFRQPQFTALGLLPLAGSGAVRRDMWEDYYDQIIRGLGIGIPVVSIDGLNRREYRHSGTAPLVTLSSTRKNNVFSPGDELAFTITNNGPRSIFVELVGTGTLGEKAVLLPATTTVAAGKQVRFPPAGFLKVQPALGKEQITLFASESEFPGGKILRGKNSADRFVHPFYAMQGTGKEMKVSQDAAKILKHTIDIETR